MLFMKQNLSKKTTLKFILSFLALIFLSFLISFLVTNWSLLKISKSERTLIEIPFNKEYITYENFELEENLLRTDTERASIRIDLENRYVEKLSYNYEHTGNVVVDIILTEQNPYGDNIEREISDRLVSQINTSVLPIKAQIDSIELRFRGEALEIKSISIDNRVKFNPYIFLTTIVIGIVLLISLLWKKQIFRTTENIFLLIATSAGILFISLFPNRIGVAWDDHIHFQNVYTLSQNEPVNWTESSVFLAEDVISSYFIFFNTPEERAQLNDYLNSSHDYSKIAFSQPENNSWKTTHLIYLPFVLGFKIPDIIGLPITVSLLISRLTNLFVYITVIYLAIKNIPIFKRGLAFIALLPGCIFLASQFSYDGPIIAFFFFAIAFLVKMILSKEKSISNKDLIIFSISALIASSTKGVYAFLLLTPLFIPKEKYKNFNQKKWFQIILVIGFFLLLASFLMPRVSTPESFGDPRGGSNVSLPEQVLSIKAHPISFIKIFVEHIFNNFSGTIMSIDAIANFAYTGRVSPNLFYFTLFFLIFFTLTDTYGQTENYQISKNFKFLFLFISGAITSLIWLALYLEFSPVGSATINGVQPRYFLPMLPLLLLIINSYKIETKISEEKYNKILLTSSSLLLFGSIISVALKVFCI